MSFTPRKLKDQFRLDVDDAEQPGDGDDSESLWKDVEIYAYMDRAQKMFAKKTKIFLDATTAALTEVAVTADDPWVTLDPRVIDIVRATLDSTNGSIIPNKFEELDGGFLVDDYGINSAAKWETLEGTPKYLITNMQADRGRLVPIPVDSDTINLVVVRYPLNTISKTSVALEVTDTIQQYILLDGMKWFAYEKQDADTLNLELARRYEAKFKDGMDDIHDELRHRRRPSRSVRYGGY